MLEIIQRTLIDDIYNTKRELAPYLDDTVPNIDARIDIFVNNRIFGHLDLLAAIYPVTKQILGADFFDAITKEYISVSVQPSGNRHEYGIGFAQFLRSNQKLENMQFVADVASIDWAYFHAALAHDANVIGIDEIGSRLAAGEIFGIKLHPSLTMISCQFNALEIWQAHQELPFEGIELIKLPTSVICWRDQNDEVLFAQVSNEFLNLIHHPHLASNFSLALSDAIGDLESQDQTTVFQAEFAHLVTAGIWTITKEEENE
jgi:hypothetical protein